MSTFFKALERAEQERALRRPTTPSGVVPTTSSGTVTELDPAARETGASHPGPAAPETLASPAPRSFFRPPRQAAPLRVDPAEELEEHLVSLLAPMSFEAEQYRALRHLVEQLRKSAELRIVAVSSPTAGDGKTTTTINLAGALAQDSDARVLLVNADLRDTSPVSLLGFEDRGVPGLVDAIVDAHLTLAAVTRTHEHYNLSVVPAGRAASAPFEILKSPRFGQLLAEARERYDYVLLDTPPIVSFPDCRVIGKHADGLLIVVAAHRTSRKLLEEALNVMESAKVVGLVFNGDDRHLSRDSYAPRRSAYRDGGRWRRRTFRSRARRT